MSSQAVAIQQIQPEPKFDPEEFFESAIAVFQKHYLSENFGLFNIASSFAKDSTLTTLIAIEAVKRLCEKGLATKPLLISNANTSVESPLVDKLVAEDQRNIAAYAKKHSLPIHLLTVQPPLNASWQVKIIGGLAITPLPGTNSWCSDDWKRLPLQRGVKNFKAERGLEGEVLTCIGTRFNESHARGVAMNRRAESATEPRLTHDGEWILSPIAHLTSDQVWELLSLIKAKLLPGAYSDFDKLFETYLTAGGSSCVLVADNELNRMGGGCSGSRLGCWACTKVKEDQSMLNALNEHPEYKPLNDIRNWLAAITFDFEKRTSVRRSLKDGQLVLSPDGYSAEVCESLLAYCLTADQIEKERADALGQSPAFQIISLESLIAIDFYWGLYGLTSPFKAWDILEEIQKGARFYPTPTTPAPRKPSPTPVVLQVGDWVNGEFDGLNYEMSGLRDPLLEAFTLDSCGAMTKQLQNGKTVLDVDSANSFNVDINSETSLLFFEFQLDYLREKTKELGFNSTYAVQQYLESDVVQYRNLSQLDEILKRTAWRERNGFSRSQAHTQNNPQKEAA